MFSDVYGKRGYQIGEKTKVFYERARNILVWSLDRRSAMGKNMRSVGVSVKGKGHLDPINPIEKQRGAAVNSKNHIQKEKNEKKKKAGASR